MLLDRGGMTSGPLASPDQHPFPHMVCASLCLTFFEQGLRTWTYRGRYAGEPPTVPSFVPVCNNEKCLRSTQGPSVSSDTEARAPTGASLMTSCGALSARLEKHTVKSERSTRFVTRRALRPKQAPIALEHFKLTPCIGPPLCRRPDTRQRACKRVA